jgi:hypothetical protein
MKNSASENAPGDVEQPAPAGRDDGRRPYTTPTLVEYGTVARLTQGLSGSGTDFSMMRMACL